MADAYYSTTTQSNTVQATVDRYIRAKLRHFPLWRGFVDVRPVQPAMPGSSVVLYKDDDLAVATTPLTELTDPDFAVSANPTGVTITLNEYGNATLHSLRLKKFTFSNIEPRIMDKVAFNMRDTLDVLVRDVASAGTNVRYANGAAGPTNTLTNASVIKSSDIRYCVAKLRGNAVQGRAGDLYTGLIHPDVSHDLRTETGSNAWRDSHIYAAPGLIWPGSIGVYEGVQWIETARAKQATDGAASAKVSRTVILGQEALAEAVADEPHAEVGVVADKLNRFFPLGWVGNLGWARFREEALYRIETGSSI